MAGPVWASGTNGNQGSSGTVTAPSGTSIGDLIVVSVGCYSSTGTPSLAMSGGGWALTTTIPATGGAPWIGRIWKKMTAADTSWTLTVTNSNAGQSDYCCDRYTSADLVEADSTNFGSGTATSITAMTTLGADRLISIAHFGGSGGAFSNFYTGTKRNEVFTGEATGDKAQAVAGSTGTLGGTISSDNWANVAIVIAQSAAATFVRPTILVPTGAVHRASRW